MAEKKTILLADDHSVVRRGVALIIREKFPFIETMHAESFDEVKVKLKDMPVSLLILDINLPGGNTVKMIEQAKQIQPEMKILMFSAFDEEQYALRYIHSGADGYLNKLTSEDKIAEAVQTIIDGGKYISEKVKEKIFENALNNTHYNPLESLSNREIEIAELLVQGEGNLEIANRLNIQMSTVSTYKNRIFEKLEVNNIVSLVEKYKLYKE
ncbi:response regulator transcription factor [Flavobacterium sp. MK4S-17]|jgi:DNA-binding NarL/FixJ family response regulator|uniref:response regulator transcription factor n=1 Tax=Flavobacterium sp. MK4S-17 TaxID=2543737 RepID=UPI00135767DD|nr:response regulator transcription factor [Flavobacterium sp. MK4S-17]